MSDNFFKKYQQWEQASKQELLEMGYDKEEVENCEVSSDGKVHFQGNFYLTNKIVTSWNESEYFCE